MPKNFVFDERKAVCKLINVICLEAKLAGGTIFGGAARDKAIKDPAADAFYAKCLAGECSESRYTDLAEDPETGVARNIISNDIDVFFSDEQSAMSFADKLTSANLYVKVGARLKQYGMGMGKTTGVEVLKLRCSNNTRNYSKDIASLMSRVRMNVDVVTGPPGLQPPFNVELDLACNGLMITPDNEFKMMPCMTKHLTKPQQRFEALGTFLEDLRANRTQLINPLAPLYRIQKSYKWTIKADHMISSCEAHRVEGEDCFICLQGFELRESPGNSRTKSPFIEMGCCKKRMHRHCAKKWLDSRLVESPCPHCGIRDFEVGDRDRRLIQAMAFLHPIFVSGN